MLVSYCSSLIYLEPSHISCNLLVIQYLSNILLTPLRHLFNNLIEDFLEVEFPSLYIYMVTPIYIWEVYCGYRRRHKERGDHIMVTMGSFIDKFPFLETTYLTYHNGSNVCGNNTILGKISAC